MTDIHCHMLFGVDDGAGNLSDCVEMAQLAVSSGTRAMIVTPHCNIPHVFENYWSDRLTDRFRQLRSELERRRIPLAVYPGQEVSLLGPDVVPLLRRGQLITLNRSQYLLAEPDVRAHTADVLEQLRRLKAEGITPIVAHPERCGFVQHHEDAAYHLKRTGCLLQINRGSLLGRFGSRARAAAWQMVLNRQADFVASDGHSPYSRTPYLADIHEQLGERCGTDYAALLLEQNPEKVLRNEKILPY